jgi:hypothetical protein
MIKIYKKAFVPALLILLGIGLARFWLNSPTSVAQTTLHFASNTSSTVSQAISNGFNLVDVTGSTSNPNTTLNTLNALPSGVQGLVWVGNLDNAPVGSACPSPGFTTAQFQNLVNALASSPKVYGYYVSDEPHPSVCPSAASDIAARADYIRQVAPGQKSFIIVQDGSGVCGASLGCEFSALNPGNSHVDYIGVDPYPCHYSGGTAVPCDNSAIVSRFNSAISGNVPLSAIVPVFQTFGQEGRTDGKAVFYRTPSTAELQSMLDTWASLAPTPAFDYSYTWGTQCSVTSCLSPQALVNQPALAAVMKSHNTPAAGGGSSGGGGSTGGGAASGSAGSGSSTAKNSSSGTSGAANGAGSAQPGAEAQGQESSQSSKDASPAAKDAANSADSSVAQNVSHKPWFLPAAAATIFGACGGIYCLIRWTSLGNIFFG